MKKVGLGIISLTILAGLVLAGFALLTDLEQARAMEHTARAVQIQAASNAVTVTGLTVVIVLLLGLVVGLAVVIVMVWRKTPTLNSSVRSGRFAGGEARRGEWISGPNARWQKRLAAGGGHDRITAEELARALMIARMLDGQAGPTPLPSGEVEDPEAWEGLFGL